MGENVFKALMKNFILRKLDSLKPVTLVRIRNKTKDLTRWQPGQNQDEH